MSIKFDQSKEVILWGFEDDNIRLSFTSDQLKSAGLNIDENSTGYVHQIQVLFGCNVTIKTINQTTVYKR